MRVSEKKNIYSEKELVGSSYKYAELCGIFIKYNLFAFQSQK